MTALFKNLLRAEIFAEVALTGSYSNLFSSFHGSGCISKITQLNIRHAVSVDDVFL